jgi:hypothetical protein
MGVKGDGETVHGVRDFRLVDMSWYQVEAAVRSEERRRASELTA